MPQLENERSFLVNGYVPHAGCRCVDIRQYYLPDSDAIRLRVAKDVRTLLKKVQVCDGDDSRRIEGDPIILTMPEYLDFRKVFTREILKTRWYVPIGDGLVAELDVFHGALVGLIMVEVEFPDEATRLSFVPPAWFGRDVSDEAWSSNGWLAGKAFDEVRPFILAAAPTTEP